MAVIAAFEFQEQIAPGDAAGEAERAHGGFGAARYEANFFEKRNGVANQCGELKFEFGGDAEAGAFTSLFGDSGGDGGMRVAEEHRSPGADEVD